MATTAYCWATRDEIASDVEPVPGPTTQRFAEIAADHDCWIVVGLAEVDPETDIYYNSAVLIGPEGPVGLYRKTHAYISEPKWAKDGDLGLPVFETPIGRIAMTICMDACYPETARVPALAGADVICFPTNWLSEKSPSPSWMARAAENGVYLIAANRYGLERGVQFSGGSAVIDPDGSLQSVIDTRRRHRLGMDRSRSCPRQAPLSGRPEDLIADRRPDAYGTMTLNTYLWDPEEFHGLYGIRPLPEARRSRVAVVQFSPNRGDVAGNLDRIARETAALAETDLIVFPELVVTGPVADRETAERLAETIPGPSTERLREIAASADAYLVAGLIERDADSGLLYNSAVLVGPGGVVGTYRKLHLAAEDRAWATPGDLGLPTFDIPPGRDRHADRLRRALSGSGQIAGARRRRHHRLSVAALLAAGAPVRRDRRADAAIRRGRSRPTPTSTSGGSASGKTTPTCSSPTARRRGMGWSGCFAAVWETEPRQESLVRGDRRGDGHARDRDARGVARQGSGPDADADLV